MRNPCLWFRTDLSYLVYLKAAEDCRHGCCHAINMACLSLNSIRGAEAHKQAFFRFVYNHPKKYNPKFPKRFTASWWKFDAISQSKRIRALIDMGDFVREFNYRPLYQRVFLTLLRRAP